MEDQVYLETKATKQIYDHLKTNKILTVTGNGGAGKSATIHHLALKLHRKGYKIFEIHSPAEMKAYLDPNCKQVFVIDDPVGIHILDQAVFNKWLLYNAMLSQCLEKGKIKFLCSIRKQIVNDPEFLRETCILNKCIVDLQTIPLDLDEKISMFELHMSVNKCKMEITKKVRDIFLGTNEQLPLLCKLFFSENEFITNDFMFFKKPFSFFFKELDKLKSLDKRKYCILVMCFVNGNSFIPEKFDVFEQTDPKTDKFIDACGVHKCEFIEELNKNLNVLNGVFLMKENNIYKFSHDVIHDVVAFHFGQKYPKQMVEYCPSRFLCERVVMSQEMAAHDPYTIVLTENLFDVLLDRLLEDLKKNILIYVVLNKCWKDEKFMRSFKKRFEKESKHIIDLFTIQTSTVSEYFDIINEDLKRLDINDTWTWYYKAMDLLRFSGITALHCVVTFANKQLFEIVWIHLTQEQRRNISRNIPLFHLACLGGDVDICRIILSDKDNLEKINTPFSDNLVSTIGDTFICDYCPLHLAAMSNDGVVKLLLDNGADINLTQTKLSLAGRSALFHASGRGKTDTVSLLIERRADVNAVTVSERTTCLMIASERNQPNVVKLLFENHAKINKCNVDEMTPLMWASYLGYENVVKILLQYQPDIDKVDNNYNLTALDFAKHKKNDDIVKLLQQEKEQKEKRKNAN